MFGVPQSAEHITVLGRKVKTRLRDLAPSGRGGEFTQRSLQLLAEYCIRQHGILRAIAQHVALTPSAVDGHGHGGALLLPLPLP